MSCEIKRWMLFVDGENFTIRGQECAERNGFTLPVGAWHHPDVYLWVPPFLGREILPGFQANPHLLDSRAQRSFYYTSVPGDSSRIDAARQALWEIGFNPMVFHKPRNRKAKSVDIMLTKDMLSNAFLDNYDAAILVTGDADYLPVVEEVKRLGKTVTIAAIVGSGAWVSSELRLHADGFYPMDEHFCSIGESKSLLSNPISLERWVGVEL